MRKQKKQESAKAKIKRQKKAYYASYESKVRWQEKKQRKALKKFEEGSSM